MFKQTAVLPVGKIWKEVRVGEDPILFAAAGDIQAKPTRVSGGLDLLGFFICSLFFFIQEPFEVFS